MKGKWLSPPGPLILLALAIFGASIFFPFIALDDAKHIWQNPYVMSFSWKNVQFFWQAPYYGLYVPLVYNFWSLLAALTQGLGLKNEFTVISGGVFHLSNVALHLLNIQLAWWLAIQIYWRIFPGDAEGNKRRALLSIVPFAIHPLQVESIAWASGLKDVLSATPTLMAMLFGLSCIPVAFVSKKNKREIAAPTPIKFFARNPPFGFFICTVMALLCKPSAVVLPVAFLVLVWAIDRAQWRKALKLALPVLAIALYFAFLTKSSQPDARLEFQLAVWQRPLVALASLGFYIFKFLAPWPLSPDYGLTPPRLLASAESYLYMGLAMLFVGAGLTALLRRWSTSTIAITWVVVGLLPILGFIPFEFQNLSAVADRYNYLFPALGMGILFSELVMRLPALKFRTFLPVGLVIAWSALSCLQTLNWRSNDHLFRHAVLVNPQSYLALNNLGLQDIRRSDFDSAEKNFKLALQAKPDYLAALANLGVAYFKRHDYPATIRHYTETLAKMPEAGIGSPATYADMHFNLGAAYLNTSQFESGLVHLMKATVINPDHFLANYHLGRALVVKGDKEGARRALMNALRLQPGDAGVMAELNKVR